MQEVTDLGGAPAAPGTTFVKKVTKTRRPPKNTSFTALSEAADTGGSEISEADRVVAIVVEAKRTHVLLSRLHSVVVLMWLVLGLFHYHPSFEARWRNHKFGILDAPTLLQNMWGAVFLCLVALRHDFPLNLLGITIATFYSGIVFGVHALRWVK